MNQRDSITTTYINPSKDATNLVQEEIEVFRLTPELNKYYETVLLTRKEGTYPNVKYHTTNTPRYVGKFIVQIRTGFGDGTQVIDIFENEHHQKVNVYYTYEGTTAFREVEPRLTKKQKFATIHVENENGLPNEVTHQIIKNI